MKSLGIFLHPFFQQEQTGQTSTNEVINYVIMFIGFLTQFDQ